MKKIIAAAAILVVCLVSGALAQVDFKPEDYTIKNKKFGLKNGLTLIVHEDHSIPVVSVNVWYHVGSRNERRGKTGFAHLFEHFFFNGSENYPHGFREAMDDLGANNRNGTTNSDRTNFFEDVPVSALERTLFLEADRMGFLAGFISKEMLERERGVVKNEKRQGENAPYGRVFGEMLGRLYPYSHPYSWSTIGEMEDLDAASLDDVKQWYKTFYGPNNAVITLTGDISPERAYALVNKYFGDIPPGPPLSRTEVWIPELGNNLRDQMEDLVPQARVYRVYHAPALKDLSLVELDLFADILAGSPSSSLTKSLVYDKKLATSVSAGVQEGELSSKFTITATVQRGVEPRVVEAEIDRVIEETLRRPIAADHLIRFQTRNLSNFLRGSERLGARGGRGDILARSEMFEGAPDAYLLRLQRMAHANPALVQKTANEWLNRKNYTMVVNPASKFHADTKRVDRSVVPPLGSNPPIVFPQIQRAKLSNGLNVILLERHSSPIVNLSLVVDAGSASEDFDKAGISSLAMDLMPEGTKTRTNFQIVEQLDAVGSLLNTSNSTDLSFVDFETTKQKLAAALPIFADVALHPAFNEEQFNIGRKKQLALIGQEKANASSLGARIARELFFGRNNSNGIPITGYEQTIEKLKPDDLSAWHRNWFTPSNSTLIISGDAKMNEILPLLETAFKLWKVGNSPKKISNGFAKMSGKQIFLLDKPDAPQSVIIAANLAPANPQAEDLAAEVLFRNFGGMSTSRLNKNLRLDKHWSYGTRAALDDSRGQRLMMVTAPVQTDKTKESMIEILREIKNIAGEKPITGQEFESIMRNMTSRLPAQFETLSSLQGAAAKIFNNSLPDDYWSTYATNMHKLSEADLAAAGKKFVKPDEIVWIIVGDLNKIESGIRSMGFGNVTVLDVDGNKIR